MTRLPVRMKLAYGVTDFGFSMAATAVMMALMYYAVKVLKLDPLVAGILLMLGKVWDAFIDPLIGYWSDRTRTRWGRRRPFFLWFALPYTLSFVLIWGLPRIDNDLVLAPLFALANLLFITFFSLLMVPYNTLGPEMTRDYDERTSLTSYRMAFSIIGALVAAPALPMVVESFPSERAGYLAMGLLFGLVISFFPFFSFFGTRETGDYPEKTPSLRSGLKAIRANKPFHAALLAFLANWVAFDVIAAVLMFYVKFCLQNASSDLLFLILFGVAALCLPLWIKISTRFGKKAAYIIGLGELAVVLLVLAFIPLPWPWAIYVLTAAAGFGVSAAHVIPYAIIPDAIEYEEYKTGENREGVYFGFVTFLQQLASASGVFLVGLFLKAFGFHEELAVQSATAQLGIKIALAVLPSVLIAVGIGAMSKYPITRSEHQRIVAALAERKKSVGM